MVGDVLASRADQLRRVAASTNPPCTALTSGNATTQGLAESWTLLGAAGGITRQVRLIVSYRGTRQARADTTVITLYCD
jgi:hypothetical protein